MKEQIKQITYYIIIGIVSLLACCFLPFIGSSIGLELNLPDTTAGWIVWGITKGSIAIINVMVFYCFMQQAKINVRDNEKYKYAHELLSKVKHDERKPRSPRRYEGGQYGKKGTTIFVSSALATIAFTQAILTFDWVSLLTYLFTIVMGLIFGILQMKSAEIYWTDEYYKYAIMTQGELKEHDND